VQEQRGVTAIVDMGVAPGMSNVLAGWGAQRLDSPDNIEIYVGGLPRARHWPFEYKAAFAPYDVIEEYTRPSRIVVNGELVIKEALSEPELLEFDGIGSLEAFNTDGLRSLVRTLSVPNMKEKTMRYPGHIALMAAFRETGLFSHEPVEVKGPTGSSTIRPIDLISTLMFPKWTYEEGEEDLTIMRVLVDGQKDGQPTRLQWDLVDSFDRASMCTSMSRTTALPCSTMARLVLDGTVTAHGIIAPELLGTMPGVPEALLARMEVLGIRYTERELPC
jgi:saccharopine dehydrogenase-like NADP-dependent oxidoreductase